MPTLTTALYTMSTMRASFGVTSVDPDETLILGSIHAGTPVELLVNFNILWRTREILENGLDQWYADRDEVFSDKSDYVSFWQAT